MTQNDVMNFENQLGDVFQQARLAKRLSVEDISNAIHLSEKQIAALEANNFDALPESVITRGFIRNYARFLELDDAPLLQAYRNLVPNVAQKSIVVKANVNEVISHQAQQPWLLYILGSIFVLLFLTAWFFYMDSMKADKEKLPEPSVAENVDAEALIVQPMQNAQQESNAPQDVIVQDQSAAPISVDPQAPVVPNEAATGAAVVDSTQVNVAQAPVSQIPVSQIPAIQVPVNQPAPAIVTKKLELQFSADAWVRVQDKAGKTILEKTAAAGSTEAIDSASPLNITIGNASAAKVKYDGKEVDLTASTSKNIIRLKLE